MNDQRVEASAKVSAFQSIQCLIFALFVAGSSGLYIWNFASWQLANGHSLDFSPLIPIGCVFLIAVLASVLGVLLVAAGKVIVVISDSKTYVATGFKAWNVKRHFNIREVRDVKLNDKVLRINHRYISLIELQGVKPLRFGSMLSDERKRWLVKFLKLMAQTGGKPPKNWTLAIDGV